MVSLLCGVGGREGWGVGDTAAWRLNILCFAVLTTRERDIEITQRPQRDLFSLCEFETERLRSCDMHVFVCTCAYMCVYGRVRVCACGVKRSEASQTPKSWRGLILSFTLSLLFSVVLCCLVVFVMKKNK